jgi:alpha-glucosidase
LRWGEIAFIDTAEPVLAFTRRLAGQTVLVVFNLAGAAIDIRLPATPGKPRPLDGHGLLQGHFDGDRLRLPGYGAWFASVE